MITPMDEARLQVEAVRHCERVWPMVLAGKEDLASIRAADYYLGEVKATAGVVMYRIVITMLEKASGLSWAAITGSELKDVARA